MEVLAWWTEETAVLVADGKVFQAELLEISRDIEHKNEMS
jgi:hypothetical protein